jgi:hypothetical protein
MAGDGAEADRAAMAAAVEAVGRWWSEAPYFAAAERHMDEQWRKLILPFLRFDESGIDCAGVVELGAGRGRTAAKLLPSAGELHLVDLHANNLEACRRELSEIPCLGPYDAAEGAIVCRDANSPPSRMNCWTSSWPDPTPGPLWPTGACWTG